MWACFFMLLQIYLLAGFVIQIHFISEFDFFYLCCCFFYTRILHFLLPCPGHLFICSHFNVKMRFIVSSPCDIHAVYCPRGLGVILLCFLHEMLIFSTSSPPCICIEKALQQALQYVFHSIWKWKHFGTSLSHLSHWDRCVNPWILFSLILLLHVIFSSILPSFTFLSCLAMMLQNGNNFNKFRCWIRCFASFSWTVFMWRSIQALSN